VTTKYLAKFQSPRAMTWPKIIGPERNVNLICNLSLYTHIPNIKSISQSIVKKSGRNCFISGITDMGNTLCPSHLVAGTKKIIFHNKFNIIWEGLNCLNQLIFIQTDISTCLDACKWQFLLTTDFPIVIVMI
jgi:hypothetical protein